MRKLQLYGTRGKGKYTLVDDDIIKSYGHLHWRLDDKGYVVRWLHYKHKAKKVVKLHRLVIGVAPGVRVDHINGDIRDNRLANLRTCTNAENGYNSGKRRTGGTSKYKGVHRIKEDEWRSSIMLNYQKFNLGHYPTEEDAAYVYDQVAMQFFGEFARPNLLH